ncbi:MAG: aminotransferase class IV [Chloroflexota bacterium]|nr:aminotransferase class IV [Chloroflexota bacterium]
MPSIIRILTADKLQPAPYTAGSLADAAQYEPHDGVYTVTNTYEHTKTLKLAAHLDRLEDSAARSGIPLSLDRLRLREALRRMIVESGYGDVRFRITVPKAEPDQFILTIEPYTPPSDTLVQHGIRVITVANSARHNAAAKTTDWLHDREALEKSLPQGVYTALLCDEAGYLLEGLSSNFYAILSGELRTASAGVLPGIAQQIVFEVAPTLLSLRKDAVHHDDIPRLDEAFITSSSRGIIPVIQIDDYVLGDGTPGVQTRRLRAAYQAWVQAHLEEL